MDFLETGDQHPADEPATCLSSLLEELAAHGCDAGGFRADVGRWAISMAAEQDLDPGSVACDDYDALRKDTIFVSCLMNSVLSRSRTLGSRDRAVLEAIAQHNSYASEFRGKERLLRAGPDPHDPSLDKFLTVVRRVINGNLAGTRHLVAERYKGSSEELRKLNFI